MSVEKRSRNAGSIDRQVQRSAHALTAWTARTERVKNRSRSISCVLRGRPYLPRMLRRFLSRLRPSVNIKNMLVPVRARAGTAKIGVHKVDHHYENDVAALADVNIDIHPGEFVCLLGP